jgi:hypothetical protein
MAGDHLTAEADRHLVDEAPLNAHRPTGDVHRNFTKI